MANKVDGRSPTLTESTLYIGMNPGFQSILVGTMGLSLAAIVAAALALSRDIRPSPFLELSRVKRVGALAIALHCAHFTEEWYTGFYTRFPEMLGLVPWSSTFFAFFNVTWIAIWCLCIAFLPKHPRVLSFPMWFLAIASATNGVIHPILSAVSGGYFPGLWSSPLVGIAGLLLLRALSALTRPAIHFR